MPTRMKFRERREERRETAARLSSEREKRGDAGQLARLEAAGRGHCKEAGKLRQKLSQPSPAKGSSKATQKELRQHLLNLGMSEESIGTEEIPQGVLLLVNRPLTKTEKEWAKMIVADRK